LKPYFPLRKNGIDKLSLDAKENCTPFVVISSCLQKKLGNWKTQIFVMVFLKKFSFIE
jgi:hypothetical protein